MRTWNRGPRGLSLAYIKRDQVKPFEVQDMSHGPRGGILVDLLYRSENYHREIGKGHGAGLFVLHFFFLKKEDWQQMGKSIFLIALPAVP